MKYIFIAMALTLIKSYAYAADIYVVDVRRNITLAENDPVYKDFYLSNAPGAGLKKNMVVTVVRKVNIRDASGASAVGEIQVPVGQLRIIAVYEKVAVAREFALLSRDELPMLEQIGIMTGDKIETQGSFQYSPKKTSEHRPLVPANPVETAKVTEPIADKSDAINQPDAVQLSSGEMLEKIAKSSY